MRLYLAGLYTTNFELTGNAYRRLTPNEKAHRRAVQYYLESYHYINRPIYVNRIRQDKCKVFLDSGAFSSFTQGIDVNITEYCNYIKENKDIIENIDDTLYASVLDGIGDPLKTWQNQMTMEKQGVRPLPCFHYGEDEEYLKFYIANYPYITLGGMVPISTPQLKLWLDRIWADYLTDSAGHPKLKVHGFGMTTVKLMERYPWYSVDSSSWIQSAFSGSIYMVDYGTLPVSKRSPATKIAGAHFDTMPAEHQQAIVRHLEVQGFEINLLRNINLSRWAYNCYSFGELNRRINTKDRAFKRTQEAFF